MRKAEFLGKLDSILELDPGTLTGDEQLSELSAWDSLTLMSYIALVNSSFGVRLTGAQLRDCRSVNDLVGLVGDRISPE